MAPSAIELAHSFCHSEQLWVSIRATTTITVSAAVTNNNTACNLFHQTRIILSFFIGRSCHSSTAAAAAEAAYCNDSCKQHQHFRGSNNCYFQFDLIEHKKLLKKNDQQRAGILTSCIFKFFSARCSLHSSY